MQALLPDLELDPLPPEEDPRPGTDAGGRRRNVGLFIQIGGLVAGSWVFFVATMAGSPDQYTWAGLLGRALRYAFLTWSWSAAVTFLLYFTMPADERRDVGWNTLRVSSAAVWFAPAMLLLSEWSPSTLAAGLVVTLTATRMLYTQWRTMHPQAPLEPLVAGTEGLFGGFYAPRRVFRREVAPALVCALVLQLGFVEASMQRRFMAAVLLVAGSAMLAIQAVGRGAWSERRPASLPRSFFGALVTILLAATLTVAGLRGHVAGSGFFGGGNSPVGVREMLRQFLGLDQPKGSAESAAKAKKQGAGSSEKELPAVPDTPPQAFGGTFPGVILRPEVQPVVTLIAPLPAVKNGYPSARPAQRFSIPFGGEYWMYRWGPIVRRPPLNSYRQTGSPAELSFRTVDQWPLEMEAHQKLIQPIALECCAAVEVEIRNADPAAWTVQMELIAVDGRGVGQSLGLAPVKTRPDTSKEPVTPVAETLEFAMPGRLTIGMAEELQVVFRRMRAQAHRSAKIAIDRFVLVPR